MTLREREQETIRGFVAEAHEYLTGEVLDFGAGQQPYRDIIEDAGGTYHPYDRARFPASKAASDVGWDADAPRLPFYDAVVCTQVIQYIPEPLALLRSFRGVLNPGGVLVLTGPTNWPVVERTDLWRFTAAGARHLVVEAGLRILREVERFHVTFEEEDWPVGWGILARENL